MNFQKIKLLGGAEVTVDMDARWALCKKCRKPIRFGVTKNNKLIPIIPSPDKQAWQSHFTDCPAASEFRKTDSEERILEAEKNQEMLNNL